MAWAYCASVLAVMIVSVLVLAPAHADLVAERSKFQPGTKS